MGVSNSLEDFALPDAGKPTLVDPCCEARHEWQELKSGQITGHLKLASADLKELCESNEGLVEVVQQLVRTLDSKINEVVVSTLEDLGKTQALLPKGRSEDLERSKGLGHAWSGDEQELSPAAFSVATLQGDDAVAPSAWRGQRPCNKRYAKKVLQEVWSSSWQGHSEESLVGCESQSSGCLS